MKVVINRCYGGFGLSELAYEKLIEYGIPVRKYIEQKIDSKTGLFLPEPLNDGEVIFDSNLSDKDDIWSFMGRYWDTWTSDNRAHPLMVKVVEELGEDANGRCAELKIVEIPDGIDYTIEEYDGIEWVAEKHRTWE